MKLDPEYTVTTLSGDRSIERPTDRSTSGAVGRNPFSFDDAAAADSQTKQLEELLNFNSSSPQPPQLQSGRPSFAAAAEAPVEASGAPEAGRAPEPTEPPQRADSAASVGDDPLAGWYWHAREESASRGADDALLAVQQQSQLRQLDADYESQRKKLLAAFQEDGKARTQLRRDFAVEAEQRREIEEQLLAVKAA